MSGKRHPDEFKIEARRAVLARERWHLRLPQDPSGSANEANTQRVKDYYEAIHPYSGSEGGYFNFMSGDDDARAPAGYGTNYNRLAQVKTAHDPANLLHVNQNIAPVDAQ